MSCGRESSQIRFRSSGGIPRRVGRAELTVVADIDGNAKDGGEQDMKVMSTRAGKMVLDVTLRLESMAGDARPIAPRPGKSW